MLNSTPQPFQLFELSKRKRLNYLKSTPQPFQLFEIDASFIALVLIQQIHPHHLFELAPTLWHVLGVLCTFKFVWSRHGGGHCVFVFCFYLSPYDAPTRGRVADYV